jgi:hypothetical protein
MISTGSGSETVMRLAALITFRTASNASLIYKNSQEELVELFVLSLSISRYPSSIFEQHIRKASQKKGLTQIQRTREIIEDPCLNPDVEFIQHYKSRSPRPRSKYKKHEFSRADACFQIFVGHSEQSPNYCLRRSSLSRLCSKCLSHTQGRQHKVFTFGRVR